jgi:1-acyl-sn-glycerol-3-phosphate acyltransferase
MGEEGKVFFFAKKKQKTFGLGVRVRGAAYALYFYGVTTLFVVVGWPWRVMCPQRVLPLARAWAGTVLAGLRPICGITLHITGREHLPATGPALLASQHQSAFDTLVWMVQLARPAYIMKQELTRLPLFGSLLVPAGMIAVDRKGGAAALKRLLLDVTRARDEDRQIVIFPEGTRVPPGGRVKLQPGIAAIAGRLDLPVLPVATDSGICWQRSPLGRTPGIIHIAIGPPIPAYTPRADMLHAIESFWRACESTGFEPGDNSVDQAALTPGGGAPCTR